MNDDLIVCRCEEVTLGEIKEAIKSGARTVTDVKRRTRAGMGLCQGKSCEIIVLRQLSIQLGLPSKELDPAKDRPPVRPISFGILGDEYND
ncbi:MAG: (2Fe-2S)-binding protein [Halanaerobiales bacterium]|nr:(2Fe-2S)-binding protein [Halanaerobiales bacterium]